MTIVAKCFRSLVNGSSLPNESQCQDCGYFYLEHPAVRELLQKKPRSAAFAVCKCKTQKARTLQEQQVRIFEANLPHSWENAEPRTFDNWIPRPGTEEMYAAAQQFPAGSPRLLIFTGATGSGKTHILEAMARKLLAAGVAVVYEPVAQLLQRFRATYREGGSTLFEFQTSYNQKPVLFLDDLGAEKASEWTREQLTMLVDHRLLYSGRLVTASNKTPGEFESNLGPRLASRLFGENTGEVRVVVNAARDFRRLNKYATQE